MNNELPDAETCDRALLAVSRNPQSLRFLPLSDTVGRSESERGISIAGVLFYCFVVLALAALMGWGM